MQKFKKGDLIKIQYPVAFENGEQLAKCTGVVISVEQTPHDNIGPVGPYVVEVQWSNLNGYSRRYYSESLMLIARAK